MQRLEIVEGDVITVWCAVGKESAIPGVQVDGQPANRPDCEKAQKGTCFPVNGQCIILP